MLQVGQLVRVNLAGLQAEGVLFQAAVTDAVGSAVSVLLYPVLTGPNATLSSTLLDFGTQLVGTTSSGSTVVLSNDGTATLNISSIAASANFSETA